MKVLVIGGTRFVGRAIVEELLHRAHEVTIYHRGQHEAVFSSAVRHVHGDRRDYPNFEANLRRLSVDAVVDVIAMNAEDTRSLVRAVRGRIQRSVHISSGDVYSPGRPIPIPEEAPLAPVDLVKLPLHGQIVPYSKVSVEAALREAQETEDFPATVLRLPAVYGPRDPLAREWFFVKRVLDGRQRIALPDGGLSLFHRGYVDDIARTVALALESPTAVGRTYNVGHERVLTVSGIAELVAQVMGHEWDIVSVPNDRLPATNPYATPYHIVYDLSRIRAELGFRESVSLEQGMQRTVEWLMANPPTAQTWGVARYLKEDAFDYAAEDAAIAVVERLRGGDAV